jgi:hypothetical protein
MRKGYTLTELLILLAIAAIIAIPIGRLSKVIIYDVPKSMKLIDCDRNIQNALMVMRIDMDSATSLADSDGNLLVMQKEKTINYTFKDAVITRTATSEEGKSEWEIPQGVVNWHVWEKEGKGYAVEIKKYVELKRHNMIEKKMENTFVFFAGDFMEKTK